MKKSLKLIRHIPDYNSAMDFLMDEIKPEGQFRIHTNKSGIRLYIETSNKELCWLKMEAECFYNKIEKNRIFAYTGNKYIYRYTKSIVARNLIECVKHHLELFPYGKLSRFHGEVITGYKEVPYCDFIEIKKQYQILIKNEKNINQ